jgi:transcriptional regulator with GAF, ATPase, and Fis domain
LARTPTSQHRLLEIAKALQPYFPFEYLSVGFRSDNRATYNAHGFLRIGFDEYQEVGKNELMIIARLNERELAELEAATVHEVIPSFYNEETLSGSLKTASIKRLLADTFQLKSLLVLPMPYSESESFSFSFFSRRPAAYNAEYIAFFSRIQRVLTKALESFFSKIPKQQAGRVSTRATTPEERFFEGIIGKSHLLLNVFDNILQVAPTETSVLILGESGTGKERIAESIHRISPRIRAFWSRKGCFHRCS